MRIAAEDIEVPVRTLQTRHKTTPNMKQLASTLLLLICLLSLNAQTFEERIFEIQSDKDLLGGCALVFCQDSVIARVPFGTANLTSNTSFNADTPVRIASISKLVTALAVIHLSENTDSFSIDADISNYLGFTVSNPSFPNTSITARMLLSHQSSIIDGSQYSAFLSATYSNPSIPSISELITPGGAYYSSDIFNSIQPGTYFNYSNLNYGILGTIIEGVSGERFDDYCKNHLFEPMGLNASYDVSDLENINDLAAIYRKFNGVWEAQVDDFSGVSPGPGNSLGYQIGTNGLRFAPQGGLRISANDLAKIMQLFLNNGMSNGNQIISANGIASMMNNEWLFDGSNGNNYFGLFQSWGLGVHRSNTATSDLVFSNTDLLFGHPGEAYGLVSDAYISPELNGGFVFFTNGCGAGYTVPANSAYYTVELDVFEAIEDHVDFTLCGTTGIDAIIQKENIQGYPNPAASFIEIPLIHPGNNVLVLKVIDDLGKLVFESPIQNTEVLRLDISTFAPGHYLFQIHNVENGQLSTGKFVKK
jgi:CubicO group peptidase (beta-lactamase class C family)